MKGLFITGTDTNVGKTWVGSQLVSELSNRNISIKARKPIESGWPETEADIKQTDAWQLTHAMGQLDQLGVVCKNRFSAALSPDRAAMLEGEYITLKQLYDDCYAEVSTSDFLFVEGAGGFYSPICSEGLNADLAQALSLPVLLVVEDRLGCINQTLLNVEAIASKKLSLLGIVLNRSDEAIDDVGMDNLTDIRKRVGCDVVSLGYGQTKVAEIQQLADLVLQKQA